MADVERYLQGLRAVVTGGSRGIGAAITSALAQRGARFTILARAARELAQHVETLTRDSGILATGFECDVTDAASVRSALGRAAAIGRVDILVNNAGSAESRAFTETSRDDGDRMISVNLTSAFLCTAEVFPAMKAARVAGGELS